MSGQYAKRISFDLFLLSCWLFLLPGCSDSLLDAAKTKYANDFKKIAESDEWLIKINNEYRYRKNVIEKDRELLVKWYTRPEDYKRALNDKNLHALYLDTVLNQNLLILQGLKERAYDNDEFRQFLWITIRDAMAQYYVKKRFFAEDRKSPASTLTASDRDKLIKKYESMYKSIGISDATARTQAHETVMRDYHNAQLKAYENALVNELKLGNKIELKR
ncbi:MAG TPA: hypothetical protein PL088_14445 [Spirochaetota bacterium]|nr:hypothetical protein [Spirochaetota bacterium]